MTIIWCMIPDRNAPDNFLLFWTVFCPFTCPSYGPRKSKFWKKMKKTPGDIYHFKNVYHKWQSYDAWFPGYRAWQTEFSVTLDHFLPFNPKTTQKILPKMTIMWCMVPEIWSMMSRTFCHFGPFFNLLPR